MAGENDVYHSICVKYASRKSGTVLFCFEFDNIICSVYVSNPAPIFTTETQQMQLQPELLLIGKYGHLSQIEKYINLNLCVIVTSY